MTIDIATHKKICLMILKDIFGNPSLGAYLGFKGGTAALFFYGLTRFSVDLDFDLLDPAKEESIFEAIIPLLEKYGKLRDLKNKRFSLLYHLTYDGKKVLADNIKVEINKRNFGSSYTVKEFLGIPMKVMIQEDMFANKLIAMRDRIGKANRDIYDVWFFFSNNWPVNKKMIEVRTGLSYKVFLQKCIEALSNVNNRRILDGLGLLLTPNQKTWGKAHLLEDTIFLLRLAESNEQ